MTRPNASTQQPPPATSWPERRVAPRYPCRAERPSRLIVSQRQECRWAQARDISTSGISLFVSARLEPGTQALLRLQGKGDRPPLALVVEVVHATAQLDGSWLIGCRFTSVRGELDEAERFEVQEHFRHGSSEDTYEPAFSASLEEKLHNPFAPIFDQPRRARSDACAFEGWADGEERRATRIIAGLFHLFLVAGDRPWLRSRLAQTADVVHQQSFAAGECVAV